MLSIRLEGGKQFVLELQCNFPAYFMLCRREIQSNLGVQL